MKYAGVAQEGAASSSIPLNSRNAPRASIGLMPVIINNVESAPYDEGRLCYARRLYVLNRPEFPAMETVRAVGQTRRLGRILFNC
jgi:hypothetical protein